MDNQETYTIQELFDFLPITIMELSRKADINEVTLARIRDGKSARRSTVNKLLIAMSEVYGRNLSIRNVTGINSMTNKKLKEEAYA